MIKAIKGTKDTLPTDIPSWRKIEDDVRRIMENFGYYEIRTPVFEETALFSRGIGEATDIVSKEMYSFTDRSGTSITLKPEMTAAVVRAFIEHNLGKIQNLNKVYYISPMFRQERPQAGRLRQFHQFGAEALGCNDPSLDAEMIILAWDIIRGFGLKDLTVKINSLGIPSSRENYRNILREYLSPHLNNLSEDSRNRFDTNVLRIFDSKVESDQEIMKGAPLLLDHLDEESLDHFNKVKEYLDTAEIPYEVDPKLVRGLDYYTNTTFEILSNSVGSQSALCGGGRYDLLIEQLGGKTTPGIGFAAGIERILLACENENSLDISLPQKDIYITRIEKELQKEAYALCVRFRRAGLNAEYDYSGRSVKAQMREANKLNAKYVLMLGGDEYANGKILLKNMRNSEQEEFDINSIDEIINKLRGV